MSKISFGAEGEWKECQTDAKRVQYRIRCKKNRNLFAIRLFGWIGIFCIFFLFVGMSVADAQINRRSLVHYGFSGNLHQTRINEYHLASKGRIGADIGFFAQIPIQFKSGYYSYSDPLFYVVPQLEFSMMGENAKKGTKKYNYHYGFVEIPVYAKYYIRGVIPYAHDRFFAMVGPVMGFAVNEKTDKALTHDQDIAQKESFQDFNFGISLAIGYSPVEGLEGFIRLDRGLTKVYNNYDSNNYHVKLGVGINWVFY